VIDKVCRRGCPRCLFSYDLSCKYCVNFLSRVTGGGGKVKLFDIKNPKIDFLVPKFHLASHKPSCADTYSFNFTPLVGRMSGELVETVWSCFNWLQYSTREMGGGNRRDILFDHMNFWNWCKIIRMRECFDLRFHIPQYRTPFCFVHSITC